MASSRSADNPRDESKFSRAHGLRVRPERKLDPLAGEVSARANPEVFPAIFDKPANLFAAEAAQLSDVRDVRTVGDDDERSQVFPILMREMGGVDGFEAEVSGGDELSDAVNGFVEAIEVDAVVEVDEDVAAGKEKSEDTEQAGERVKDGPKEGIHSGNGGEVKSIGNIWEIERRLEEVLREWEENWVL
jgi:hypothetical protein